MWFEVAETFALCAVATPAPVSRPGLTPRPSRSRLRRSLWRSQQSPWAPDRGHAAHRLSGRHCARLARSRTNSRASTGHPGGHQHRRRLAQRHRALPACTGLSGRSPARVLPRPRPGSVAVALSLHRARRRDLAGSTQRPRLLQYHRHQQRAPALIRRAE